MNFVAANCPQCSAALQVPDNREIVKCMYCGVDIIVQQAIQLGLGNSKNFLELARSAANGGNHSEAHAYYTRVLEIEPTNAEAWFGKGTAAGWLSNLNELRLGEMLTCYSKAITLSHDDSAGRMTSACGRTANQIATACYSISQKHALEFITVPHVWRKHLQRCQEIIATYEVAHIYSPHERLIMENIITVCQANIEGVKYYDTVPGLGVQGSKVECLSVEYEQTLRGTIGKYASQLKQLDPRYVPPNPQRKTPGCFVVTATLGNERHPKVVFLRSFRDEFLVKSAAGSAFVTWYCKHGPTLAARIEKSKLSRLAAYLFIVIPAVGLARVLMCAVSAIRNRTGRV